MFEDPENKIEQIEALVMEPEAEIPQQIIEAIPTKAEINFKELRDKVSRIEKERDEALLLAQQLQNKSAEIEEEYEVSDEDFAQGKHLAKMNKEIRDLKNELKIYHQQSTQTSVESRLKSQYQDFDKIVTKENIDQLREQFPELATTLNATTDLYSKAVSAYTLIKKFGIVSNNSFDQNKELAQKNINKPRPPSSVGAQTGMNPLTQANSFANGLTEELKANLLKEMVAARRDY